MAEWEDGVEVRRSVGLHDGEAKETSYLHCVHRRSGQRRCVLDSVDEK